MLKRERSGPALRLVAAEGGPVVYNVPVSGVPEEPLQVSFTGINSDEQRAALAAFPGGKRFILVQDVAAPAPTAYLARRRSASC